MRFEKISENKIRIFLSHSDLIKNNTDFHNFMSNPLGSQTLFLKVLNEAERQVGFYIKNYDIKVEIMQIANKVFILTITKITPDRINKANIKRVHIKKTKLNYHNLQNTIYVFNTFDDFCLFSIFLKNANIKTNNIAKNIALFEYNSYYYLFLTDINSKNANSHKVLININEFASHLNYPSLFKYKILDSGKMIMKNNAFEIASKYFT